LIGHIHCLKAACPERLVLAELALTGSKQLGVNLGAHTKQTYSKLLEPKQLETIDI
jgi:hypothetical protein